MATEQPAIGAVQRFPNPDIDDVQQHQAASAGVAAAAAPTVDRQVPSVSHTTTAPAVMAAILARPST
jgi:hypothetical protein